RLLIRYYNFMGNSSGGPVVDWPFSCIIGSTSQGKSFQVPAEKVMDIGVKSMLRSIKRCRAIYKGSVLFILRIYIGITGDDFEVLQHPSGKLHFYPLPLVVSTLLIKSCGYPILIINRQVHIPVIDLEKREVK